MPFLIACIPADLTPTFSSRSLLQQQALRQIERVLADLSQSPELAGSSKVLLANY